MIISEILTFCVVFRSYHCACADNKFSGNRRRRWEFPFRYGGPDRGFFPNKQASRSAKFRANGSHGRTMFRGGGGPTVTICLLCACGLLLLASGIEPNPGPDTPRTDIPTPCEEPLVTPHRRPTTKSVSDNAGAAPHVNCMQCNRTSPDQPTIKCSICRGSIHLGCLKAGNYLEGQGWRKQEPPQYIGQLFNSPYFKFICHPCVANPSPILQEDISFIMRSIEPKLDILTSSVVGATTDPDTDITTSAGSKTRGARSKLMGMGPPPINLLFHDFLASPFRRFLGRVDVLNHFEPALSVCCPLWAYHVFS